MNNIDFRFYFALFLRRLPAMMALVLIGSGFGIVTALNLPPTYQTAARLLVEAPQIPDSMAASTVRTDATDQLRVIEQQLLTRANLIDIANKFDVFENMREMTPTEVEARMREQTRISRDGSRDEATLMTLSFTARDGRIAANVVSEYVNLILAKANDFRISRVESTSRFFEQEVERLAGDLDLKSAEIVSFKNANATALPDDLNYRLGRQALLQERLGRLERDRSALEAQRAEIVRLFERTGRVQVEQDRQLTADERRLNELEGEMEQARTVYSATNPRIVLLQNRIDVLRERVAEQAGAENAENADPDSALLEISLSEIDSRLRNIDEETEDASEELDTLAASIAATSTIAIELAALERDYDNIQSRYTAAINNLNRAQMGERIEVSAQGQRISVIEGANIPQEPSGPNRTRIAAAGIGAGLAAAAALFVLLEVLNRNIRHPGELRRKFDIVPIATIPYMETRWQKFRRRAFLVAAFLFVLAAVPLGLWYIDTNYMPLELLADKVMKRIGL